MESVLVAAVISLMVAADDRGQGNSSSTGVLNLGMAW